jgi:hypothetical protein
MPCDGDDAKVSFPSVRKGWLLCLWGPGVGNEGKDVYETLDEGATWRLRARAPFAVKAVGRLETYGYPTGLAFRSNGRGWMPQLRGAALASGDGGRTWTRVRVTEPEVKLGLSVSFVSDATGFMLINDGVDRSYELERTNEGGSTWHVVHRWPFG